MIASLGQALNRIARRTVPDPFILALGLTALAMPLGFVMLASRTELGAGEMTWTLLTGWFNGFADKDGLAFALQMCLVLVTGHALALSPPVQRLVDAISKLPKTTSSSALLVAVVACIAAVIHWGLGAIVGALLAREIARGAGSRGVKLHYPLLGAAAYAGLAVWHGGVSGSAPLKVAESGHFVEQVIGVLPMSQTVLGPMNLLVTGVLLVLIPVLFWAMARSLPEINAPDPDDLKPLPVRKTERSKGLVAWLQESSVPGLIVGLGGLVFVVAAGWAGRIGFDLNSVNLTFLCLGMALHGGTRHYVQAVADGARGAGAIVLQFPFYFGILGIMKASGLVQWVSEGFANVSSAGSFPVLTFLSAGLVNMFVPSGGGQWAIQGEVLLRAGQALGVDPATTVMAFSYGDAWTNMLQPFWALPLLGIMGLRARDIIGYTAVIFLALLAVVPVLLWLAA